jgi:hypothetical protein
MGAATKDDIRSWLANAQRKGATHMLVACDTFDHEDYYVLVMPGEDAALVYREHDGPNMQRVHEVYDLSLPIEAQLAEFRAMHLPFSSEPEK